ncbi:MAG: phosphopyruvate hydratase [Candidatus Levybacteria bacterium]|nr:phosphopyruvate hydratase [Candidatus Levybacteria bacterium]
MAAKIKKISAREILDCRGLPTIESMVQLSDGIVASASCPSGTSVGTYEAVELRDHDAKHFLGKGVLKAIENINTIIAPKLTGMDPQKQPDIDKLLIELDGTQNKGHLGANATLAVSMAVCRAAAASALLPLFLHIRQFIKRENLPAKIPTPIFNIINGGLHAGGNLDFQEFIIVPASSISYVNAIQMAVAIYFSLADVLKQNGYATLVGNEGGFGPNLTKNSEAFELITRAVTNANYRIGYDVFLGLDAAANSFHKNNAYTIKESPKGLSGDEIIKVYDELNKIYNILYLEDPLSEDDWDTWVKLAKVVSPKTLLIGDDLTVTNPYRLQMAIDKQAISGIIIKPNQIGTVIEALAVIEVAREANLKIIISHRSGETNDDFIADFAVAASADYVKFGAPARGERVAKYNRLLAIENQLKSI